MITIYIGLVGLAAFVGGTIFFGVRLRSVPTKENAEQFSRSMHFLFFAGLGAPFMIGIFYPGLSNLDPLVGLPPLPLRPLTLVVGVILAIPGLYFMGNSNKLLRSMGSGANAFRLTWNECLV